LVLRFGSDLSYVIADGTISAPAWKGCAGLGPGASFDGQGGWP